MRSAAIVTALDVFCWSAAIVAALDVFCRTPLCSPKENIQSGDDRRTPKGTRALTQGFQLFRFQRLLEGATNEPLLIRQEIDTHHPGLHRTMNGPALVHDLDPQGCS